MPKQQTKEARHSERRRANDYYLLIDRRTSQVIGRITDLSLGGFKMICDCAHTANTPLECQMSFPRSIGNVREVPLEATVRWCFNNSQIDCFEVGCQIHEPSEPVRGVLELVIDEFEG